MASAGLAGGAMAGAELPFRAVLVANRGEIAVRLVRAVRGLGLRAVAVYAPADAGARHVGAADGAVALTGAEGYMDVAGLVAAAVGAGCGAVLPGYEFVSEQVGAVRAFEEAGVAWCGPGSGVIELFGGMVQARAVAEAAGVACVP